MSTQEIIIHPFTTTYPGIALTLKTEIRVGYPFDQNRNVITEPGNDPNTTYPSKAIWDTGATNTTITRRAAQALNLKPITKALIKGVNSETMENVYLVSIVLPNNVMFPMQRVTECSALTHPDDPEQCDVLIGMDIIANGDFAVTNFAGQTTMSFRLPSIERIDFNIPPTTLGGMPVMKTQKLRPDLKKASPPPKGNNKKGRKR